MRLPRDPHLMTAAEIATWAHDLISRRAPESDTLDYKSIIKVETRSDRAELAKDITSFANEHGGVLLFGVPEDEESGVPVPRPLIDCGLVIPPDLPERVENILVDTVYPPLPELFLTTIQLLEIAPRGLFLAYHPASWNRPHRVEYNDARYYRRANYRVVMMTEREVEAAYASRRSFAVAAREFIASGDFGEIPAGVSVLRVVIVPRFSLVQREVMGERRFRNWLDQNPPAGRQGYWVPFLDGVRFLQYAEGPIRGQQFELRLFHSGAISFTSDIQPAINQGLINLDRVAKILASHVLHYTDAAFERLRVAGPISIHVSLHYVEGLQAEYPSEEWFPTADAAKTSLRHESISFCEESSVTELGHDMAAVLKRLMVRIASAFGLWPDRSQK